MDRYIWRILLIDDDEDDYVIVRKMLSEIRQGQITLDWAASFEEGWDRTNPTAPYDAILVDYDMGAHKGTEIIRAAADKGCPSPFLLLTGQGSYEVDIEAMQAGALDYLSKNEVTTSLLERAIRYAIERKKSEEKIRQGEIHLRESQKELTDMLESINDGFFAFDREWCYTYINQRAAEPLGYQPEELIGKRLWDVFPKLLGTPAEEHYRKAMEEGVASQYIIQGAYSQRWYQISVYPSKNGISVFSIDRTEQVQAELELMENEVQLRQSEQHLNDILTSIQDGFFELDREWQFSYINERAARNNGYTPEALIGKKIWEVLPDLPGTQYEAAYRRVMETRHPEHMEIPSLQGDAWYDQAIYPSANGISVFSRDITANKRAEQALEESEGRFRVALANALIAVFSTDRDLRYNWFYSAFMQDIQENFIGKRDDEILPAEDVAELMETKREALRERKALRREIRLSIPNDVRLFIVSVEPYFNPRGELTGVIGAYLDITEQRRLETENIAHITQVEVQRRLLEYREKERQEIARDLHDGPVQDLSSLIFNLQFTKESIHDPTVLGELDQIGLSLKSVVNDLRGMINELRPPSLIRFGLAKAVQFHLEDFKEKHPEIGLEFTIVDDGNRLSEQARLNLFRILQEALNNAVNHAHATNLDIHFDCTERSAALEIRDNGKGFPISRQLVDYTVAGHFGLVGMKERAEALQGTFTISSEPNAGTVVQVTIPLAKNE